MAAIGMREEPRAEWHERAPALQRRSLDFVADRHAAAATRARAAAARARHRRRDARRRAEPASRIVQRVVAPDGGDGCVRARARRCARPRRTPRSPTAPPRTRSTTTTCASCRSRIRARRWCRRVARGGRSRAARRAARCSTPTSSASRSRRGSAASMNPRHYQRGWHCTSTLGTIGAAAGGEPPARARRGGRAATRWRSPRPRRPASRKTSGRW